MRYVETCKALHSDCHAVLEDFRVVAAREIAEILAEITNQSKPYSSIDEIDLLFSALSRES